MADMIIELVGKQRKRLVASAMNSAEKSTWWHKLTPAERDEYRTNLLAAVGVYHDFMLDVIRVSTETVAVNDHVLDMLEKVHQNSQAIRRDVDQMKRG